MGLTVSRSNPYPKKAIRIITNEHYLHHTEPLFKQSKILKIQDLYELEQLKFFHKHNRNLIPYYLQSISFPKNYLFHSYPTKAAGELRPSRPETEYSRCTVWNNIPKLVNSLSAHLNIHLLNSSLPSFVNEYKKVTLLSYKDSCTT